MPIQLLTAVAANMDKPFVYENWIIIKQLIWLFGRFMSGIMKMLDGMNIHSIALCIVIFTLVTKMVLIPFTIKQQKSSKMTAIVQPEILAIQKKYKGRTDQASQQKMLMEQQAVQEKYGVSMTAGCLPLLLQMPILFSLYPVIYRMDKYVPYLAVLKEKLSAEQLDKMYRLVGINLSQSPKEAEGFPFCLAILIPILVALSQYLTTKLTTAGQKNKKNVPDANPMNSTMKSMNIIMPIMMGWFALTFQAFLGLYWLVQSFIMAIQQYFINKYLSKFTDEQLIEESVKKANKKRAKKGQPPIGEQASMSTRRLNAASRYAEQQKTGTKSETDAQKAERLRKASEYYEKRAAAPGSLAAKANMVRDYNERNNK